MNRYRSHATTTVQSKQLKAKNPANQTALEKLLEVQENAASNSNSNFIFTVKKAVKSLQTCPTAITTREEACKLKYVGPSLAKVICPTVLTTPTNASEPNVVTKVSRKRKQATSTAALKVDQGPSKKEKAYHVEKSAAESLDVSKCGPWKVVLIVDGREHKSKHVVSKCKQSGIPCEERHLPIGDMTWIAQSNDNSTGKVVEVLCGTIIERKESSDLVGSLFGTRLLEQRLRLQNCGIPQLLFLVEGKLNSNVNCPQETLEMAIMETRCLGFHVIQTEHLQETVQKLKGLHRRIVQRTFPDAFRSELPTFTNSPSEGIGNRRRRRPTSLLEMKVDTPPRPALGMKRFLTYMELKAKVEMDREAGTRTIGAVYMAMLKQVSSLSHKKCEAISRQYPTIHALMSAFGTVDSPGTMIRDIPLDRQKMGPKSATELFVACCTKRNGVLPESNDDGATKRTAASKGTASAGVTRLPSPASSQGTPLFQPPGCTVVDLTQDSPKKPAARTFAAFQHLLSQDCSVTSSSSSAALAPKSVATTYKSMSKQTGTTYERGGVAYGSTGRNRASCFDVPSPNCSSPDSIDLSSLKRPQESNYGSNISFEASRTTKGGTTYETGKDGVPCGKTARQPSHFDFSSPDSMDRPPSHSKPTPLEKSSLGEGSADEFSSPNSCFIPPSQRNDPSILVIEDGDDEVAAPDSSSPPGLCCVSNGSSSFDGNDVAKSQSSVGSGERFGTDLRSRLAKRRKVETIEID